MYMHIGAFLARRLVEVGVHHLFGVPGDFNLSFLEQVQEASGIEFVGNCNELNAAYAADGYARTSGLAAFVTTWGVGDLGAIGGIAGAYAENVPVVHITGTPPLHAVNSHALVHHTLVDGDYDNVGRCLSEFTVAHARITPANAAFEVDRVLRSCWLERRPVHIQLPSDVTHIVIEVPDAPLVLADPKSDPDQLRIATHRIIDALRSAHNPVILVDADAERFGVTKLLEGLAEKLAIPYATLLPAKSVIDETSGLYLGTYAGAASPEHVRRIVEDSDCLIGVGLRFTDTSSALYTQRINENALIHLRRHDLSIGRTQMPGVMLKELLSCVLRETRARSLGAPADTPNIANTASEEPSTEPLTQALLWRRIQQFLKPGDVIFGEAGTSHSALSSMKMPEDATYIAQTIWGAIGYTLPATFGSLVGMPSRRHLLFIGDGSFQLTAQELSSILRRDLKPIVFLLNNAGYTIERLILGQSSPYNDISDWRYADLPSVFDKSGRALSFVVETAADLENALRQANTVDRATFIEIKLPMMDAPESLKKFADLFADFDYGERGPRNTTITPKLDAAEANHEPNAAIRA